MRIGTERMHRNFPLWLWNEHITRYLFAAKFVSEKIVVDCACGSGVGSKIFLESGAEKLYGVDVSEEAIGLAIDRNKNFQNAKFLLSDGTKIPLDNESADVYVSLETIEHIECDKNFLQEVSRVLRKDGIFICSTPNRTVSNPEKSINDKPWNSFHIREYSKQEFEDLLKNEFLEVKLYGLNKVLKSKLKFLNKIRKISKLNGYLWFNILKAPNIFFDNIENYKIEKNDNNYEYEYLIAVCTKK